MREEFTFLSSNGVYNIHCIRWMPEGEICGIVQLVHGMCEHIERYDDFACFLASKGFFVTGHDHAGHGQSVNSENDLGYFAEADARKCLVDDVHKLTELTKKLYPNKPYILCGHSMGSFIVSNYIETYGYELDAAILIGTGYNPTLKCIAGGAINSLIAKSRGEHHKSGFMQKLLMGSYNKRIKDKRTELDWLCTDEGTVDKYIEDPLCGFTFTTNANRALVGFARFENKHFSGIPKNLPILLTAGEEDPVGAYGAGVRKIYDLLKKNGITDVTIKLYKNMRHEILNENGKEQVYSDIYDWIYNKIN
ncbi:MAG: lysophospholipase [Lachnospiraceae bacterium]|nr:lysophospholipase [Lachnospiraceae bacterium]